MQISADDLALVDTNVLIESLIEGDVHHKAAAALLERAQSGEVELCLVPQVLAEFYSVVTNPNREEMALTPDQALDAIDTFLQMPGMTELPAPPDMLSRFLELARQHKVRRGDIYDIVLAAAMLGNGVHRIYTFNRRDFERLTELEVLDP